MFFDKYFLGAPGDAKNQAAVADSICAPERSDHERMMAIDHINDRTTAKSAAVIQALGIIIAIGAFFRDKAAAATALAVDAGILLCCLSMLLVVSTLFAHVSRDNRTLAYNDIAGNKRLVVLMLRRVRRFTVGLYAGVLGAGVIMLAYFINDGLAIAALAKQLAGGSQP